VAYQQNQDRPEKGANRQALASAVGWQLAPDALHEVEDFGGYSAIRSDHMREVPVFGHKGDEEFKVFAATVAGAQNLRLEIEGGRFGRSCIGLDGAVEESAAYQQEVAGSRGDRPTLDLKLHFAPEDIEDLEIIVAVHADAAARTKDEEAHVDWEERIERPPVNALFVDLRFDNRVGSFPT
jgi:hypothetical protein